MSKSSDSFEAKCYSVYCLFEQLRMYVTSSTEIPSWLLKACSSQGAIVALSKPDLGIEPMSLNTFKKCANHRLLGGFKDIDDLRKKVKGRPTQKEISVTTNNKIELHEAQRLRVTLTRAYHDLMRIARFASKHDPVIERELTEHQLLYAQYFGVVGVRDD